MNQLGEITMRLLFAAISIVVLTAQLAAQRSTPPGLFRGPLIGDREATLVVPDRGLPIEFGTARLFVGGPAPLAALSRARLHVPVRSKTVRSVLLSAITLRAAVGAAEHGMFTFVLRAPGGTAVPPDFDLLPRSDEFRPGTFVTSADATLPGMALIHPETKVVFSVERVEGVNGPAVFENPDVIELLWEALGRPSFSQ
jgi:hypothetical protein